jgi:2-oxoglutarate dehydrogenase E1 component
VSSLTALTDGTFETVIAEDLSAINYARVTRLILCSGKVYYDLKNERDRLNLDHVAIIRIEQLYPFPQDALGVALADFVNVREAIWCQEEPMNQGAWYSSQHHIRRALQNHVAERHLKYAGRAASAAAAAGNMGLHQAQQDALVSLALNGEFAEIETIQARS